MGEYIVFVLVQIFIWSFIGSAWSLMGRFGLVSLGHGAFLGRRRLHDHAPVELLRPDALARGVRGHGRRRRCSPLVVAYPCSRFGIVGHYFGLVTLAVGEVIRLLLIAERDWTGGSLGLTLKPVGADAACWPCSTRTSGSSTTARSSCGWAGSGCGAGSTARWPGRRWRRSGRTRRPRPRSASTSRASSWRSPRCRPR